MATRALTSCSGRATTWKFRRAGPELLNAKVVRICVERKSGAPGAAARSTTMRRRITTALIAFGLLFGLALWRPGSNVKVTAAPNAGSLSEAGGFPLAFWIMTGKLHLDRSHHTATLLPGGKVLVYGGIPFNTLCDPYCHPNTFVPLRSAEL